MFKLFTFKNRSRSRSILFRNQPFDDKYQNLQVVPCIFALALTISEILAFQIFDLEKLGQGQGVQFLQLRHSMANIKVNKSRLIYFPPALTVSEILTFQTLIK